MQSLILAAALLPMQSGAGVFFQETFETGTSPFRFDQNLSVDQPVVSTAAAGGDERGRVWLNRFQEAARGHPFGHALVLEDERERPDRLHWAGYVKFGYRDDQPAWQGQPFALAYPRLSDDLALRYVAGDAEGEVGALVLDAPDGQRYPVAFPPGLRANRWYAVEFGLHENGAEDRIRVWVDGDDEAEPALELTGAFFEPDAFEAGTGLSGWRGAGVPAGATFYYDDITLADEFIGLPVPDKIPPAPPSGLRVR